MQAEKSDRILRKPEVLAKIGVSDPTIYRWELAGRFPKRLRLGGQACGWLASEVEAWLQDKAAARSAE